MQDKAAKHSFGEHAYPKDLRSAITQLVTFSKLKKKNPIIYFNKEGNVFFSNNHRKLEMVVYIVLSALMLFLLLFIDYSIVLKAISVLFFIPAFLYFYLANFRALNNVYVDFKTKTIKIVPKAFLLSRIYPERQISFGDIDSFEVKSKSGGNSSGLFSRVLIKTVEPKPLPLLDFYGVKDSKLLIHCFGMIMRKGKN